MTLSIQYQNKETNLGLPTRISELRQDVWRSSLFVDAVMAGDDIKLHIAILAHLHPVWYRIMKPADVSDILRMWHLEYDWKDIPVVPAHSFVWKRYQAPPVDFRTGTLREFIYMDEYLESNDIASLCALLYRPYVDDQDALRRDDHRARLISRDQVEGWRKILHRHDCAGVRRMMAASLWYAYSIKHLISDLYGSRLFAGADTTVSHNLGWTATALQVAEQGVFGDYESVLDTTLHEVMAYLLVKKSESEAIEAARSERSQP